MTFSELRREYEKHRVGETIYGLVLELAGRVSRKYPTQIYNGGLAWDEQSVGDLAQEVVLNHLLEEGQLDYIFAEATTLESVRRLLTRQVKRALHKRRPITVIDRLLKRIDALADKGSIERIAGVITTYRLLGSTAEWRPIDSHQVTAAVNAAIGIPVFYSRLDSSRESQIFTTPALESAVKAFFSVCTVLNEQELRRILEKLLTPWAPTSLVPIEDSFETMDHSVIVTDISELDDAASAWVNALTDEECWVYYYRSRDLPDGAAAERIGKSRATVINIKQRVHEKAKNQLVVDLDPRLHLDAVILAQEHCARRVGEFL